MMKSSGCASGSAAVLRPRRFDCRRHPLGRPPPCPSQSFVPCRHRAKPRRIPPDHGLMTPASEAVPSYAVRSGRPGIPIPGPTTA